jgi:hypothetical protein
MKQHRPRRKLPFLAILYEKNDLISHQAGFLIVSTPVASDSNRLE